MFAIFAQTAQTSAAETQEAPVNAGALALLPKMAESNPSTQFALLEFEIEDLVSNKVVTCDWCDAMIGKF
uniref:Uncharacterized protein n=1 Tax=Kalmanozyma brasiliensis (strain GHG001) TaxID=1365824 RepID=V5GIU5_KALBG